MRGSFMVNQQAAMVKVHCRKLKERRESATAVNSEQAN
jgi:hypothetical protein